MPTVWKEHGLTFMSPTPFPDPGSRRCPSLTSQHTPKHIVSEVCALIREAVDFNKGREHMEWQAAPCMCGASGWPKADARGRGIAQAPGRRGEQPRLAAGRAAAPAERPVLLCFVFSFCLDKKATLSLDFTFDFSCEKREAIEPVENLSTECDETG